MPAHQQVRAVLAVKMRTLRMIQIHGTMHIGVSTALLQIHVTGSHLERIVGRSCAQTAELIVKSMGSCLLSLQLLTTHVVIHHICSGPFRWTHLMNLQGG